MCLKEVLRSVLAESVLSWRLVLRLYTARWRSGNHGCKTCCSSYNTQLNSAPNPFRYLQGFFTVPNIQTLKKFRILTNVFPPPMSVKFTEWIYSMTDVGGLLISLSRPWARRWINHWRLSHMASATPDLRLPSQPQGITAPWPVPNYTAWWQRHVFVWTTCPVLLPERARPGVEPATFGVASPTLYPLHRPPGHTQGQCRKGKCGKDCWGGNASQCHVNESLKLDLFLFILFYLFFLDLVLYRTQ